MRKLPIYNYLDLSTAHITQETDEYLRKQAKEDEAYKAIVYEKDCGYFVSVPEWDEIDDYDMPDDLKACLKFAAEHNCYWLVLDGDADTIDELKTYKW